MKFKSIKLKLVRNMILLFLAITIMSSAITVFTSFYMTSKTLGVAMRSSVEMAATNFGTQLSVFEMALSEAIKLEAFNSEDATDADKIAILNQKMEEYWCFVSFIGLDGIDIMTGQNMSNQDFYKQAMMGNRYIDDPVVGTDGKVTYSFGIPAINASGEQIGVIYLAPDSDYLSWLISEGSLQESGHIYIIDRSGNIVMDSDSSLIKSNFNAKTNGGSDYSGVATMESNAIKGAIGSNVYMQYGLTKIGAYAPVSDSDGWVIISTAVVTEFTQDVIGLLGVAVIVLATISVIAILIVTGTVGKFINDIKLCIDRITKLAEGDLTTPMPQIKANDEAHQLADSTKTIMDSLNALIADEQYVLGEIAVGNFSVKSNNYKVYQKDYAPLLESMRAIITNMNSTLKAIDAASNNVSTGSTRVADSSQSLASGVTVQAQSATELSATFGSLAEQIENSSTKATEVRALSEKTGVGVKQSNEHMYQLLEAMREINSSSTEIAKIISAIEDIASQTNILALNASVEAARAGSAGNEFAVVADEVRNLASKSAENAKVTDQLIKRTMAAVQNGSKIAEQTADSLKEMQKGVDNATDGIRNIAELMQEQSEDIARVTESVSDISRVINDTSVTSDECANTSHELSAQASALRNLVSRFKLKNN